ncbi:HlyD family secretion protein [Microbulbifer bruguierae]|uniref:HlyD family secretion protein n=1 Tax=Microbulbifer bruguierae TaxID=3029061 RepID=A0ABY8NAZ2_9GAMM|nr:HlyD family secretion protein [Microbulbifer bruguierae]WGL15973.1 HlyD family secretion protein [Microbulbifer bruguierae]
MHGREPAPDNQQSLDEIAAAQAAGTAAPASQKNEPEDPARSVGRGVKILLALILTSLCLYLLADRFTPYTSQARVQGYVVGVAPKVAGVVTNVWIGNNQLVKQGEKLFAIDRAKYELALQSARANLDNTWQQIAAGDAAVEQARANQRAAEAGRLEAQQDYTRLKRLRDEDPGTISVRRLEISRAHLEQARAQVASAEAAIQQAIEQKGGDSERNNSLLKVAQAAVDQAQLDLTNTTVVAQTDGVITDLRAEVGRYAGAGSPVLTLISREDFWISADYTENNLGHLKQGTPVEILLDALPGRVFEGRVRDIGAGVNAGRTPAPGDLPDVQNNRDWLRQAQRFPVRVEFASPPPPEVLSQLRMGGQASVIAYTDDHRILQLLGKLYIRGMSYLSYAY